MYIKNYLSDKGEVSPEMLEKLSKDVEAVANETSSKLKIELELILASNNPTTSSVIVSLTQYQTQASCAKLACEMLKKELNKRYEKSQADPKA